MCNIRRSKAQLLQMATEERLQLVGVPANHLELFEQVGRELGIIEGGRVELIFDDGHFVDGYKRERMKPTEARSSLIFCLCVISTATLAGDCVICGRPKRDG
jgi:hypothetical protein